MFHLHLTVQEVKSDVITARFERVIDNDDCIVLFMDTMDSAVLSFWAGAFTAIRHEGLEWSIRRNLLIGHTAGHRLGDMEDLWVRV